MYTQDLRVRYPFPRQSTVGLLGILCVGVTHVVSDADIVCSRAKNHYDPKGSVNLSDTATQTDTTGADGALEAYKRNFKPLHGNMASVMYFS